jgi:hypothetical protein
LSKNDLRELGRGVSVEMKHQRHVKNMIVSEEERGCVLFEGNLGQLIETSMIDNSVLEVIGENGILRMRARIQKDVSFRINIAHFFIHLLIFVSNISPLAWIIFN